MPVTDVDKDIDALTMTITAKFDADAERLWELWSDPRQLERWWSPPSHSSTFVEHELTVGIPQDKILVSESPWNLAWLKGKIDLVPFSGRDSASSIVTSTESR